MIPDRSTFESASAGQAPRDIGKPFIDVADPHDDRVPSCPLCGCPLRPDAVLFGEYPPAEAEWRAKSALRDCDRFVAVGTAGVVSPAAQYVRSADYAGATTILINLEPLWPRNKYFHEEYLGRAEDLLPALLPGDRRQKRKRRRLEADFDQTRAEGRLNDRACSLQP
jgi:NAD-dependent SIR2 family protein deacetylase